MIDPTVTLGDLVVANPSLAREFDRRQLDYCCGGSRQLAEACVDAGLDPQEVVRQLRTIEAAPAPPPWATMGMVQLVDHVEATHHRYLWEELPRLVMLADRVVEVHTRQHPELADVERLVAELRADLEPHLTKEEQVLFPLIRRLAVAESRSHAQLDRAEQPIKVMLAEHDRVGELLAALRAITHDYRPPADACGSYRALLAGLEDLEADTHLHVHKENNVLFPMARAEPVASSATGTTH